MFFSYVDELLFLNESLLIDQIFKANIHDYFSLLYTMWMCALSLSSFCLLDKNAHFHIKLHYY